MLAGLRHQPARDPVATALKRQHAPFIKNAIVTPTYVAIYHGHESTFFRTPDNVRKFIERFDELPRGVLLDEFDFTLDTELQGR